MNHILEHQKTREEHMFTSTGIKFWRHREAMLSYQKHTGNTVISTHVSPEGACNLDCSYCSVSRRRRTERIELEVIQDYILKLRKRGLKAVILTGGGEPTLYPQFNELVRWLRWEQELSVALITNGTRTRLVDQDVWDCFSWVRVSMNRVENYKEKISFPRIKGVLGASMVYSGQELDELRDIASFVDTSDARYVRVLPNCLLSQEQLISEHLKLENLLRELGHPLFFQQYKLHGLPCSGICHQAYFRPYLSEVNGGTVFPCDSLVLNDEQKRFAESYAICKAGDIDRFLDGEIKLKFNAHEQCEGCVFTENIKLLDDWLTTGKDRFEEYPEAILHEEFV